MVATLSLRRTPVLTIDGRGIYGLTSAQYQDVRLALVRYYRWEASGRQQDPWASGVARGSWATDQRVRGSKPGSRSPGECAPTEPDSELLVIEAMLAELPSWQRLICRLKSYGDGGQRVSDEDIAERLGCGAQQVETAWRQLATRLYYRLQPAAR